MVLLSCRVSPENLSVVGYKGIHALLIAEYTDTVTITGGLPLQKAETTNLLRVHVIGGESGIVS